MLRVSELGNTLTSLVRPFSLCYLTVADRSGVVVSTSDIDAKVPGIENTLQAVMHFSQKPLPYAAYPDYCAYFYCS